MRTQTLHFSLLNLLLFKIFQFFPQLSADYILEVRIPLYFADQKFMLRSPPIHIVWATIFRAVCLVLSVCYLSVFLSVLFCLAVSLVHWPGDWMDWNEI